MPLSLNIIIASLVSFIAAVVAAVCVSLALTTFTGQIDTIGRSWAAGLTNGVFVKMKSYMLEREASLLTASNFAKSRANALPTDLSVRGLNWTSVYFSFIYETIKKLDFNFVSFSIIFEDQFWVYAAPSVRLGSNVMMIEWIEFSASGNNPAFGGLRFWKDNVTIIPYDASTNFQPEGVAYVYPKPLTSPDFMQLRNFVVQYKAVKPDKTQPIFIWSDLSFDVLFGKVRWELFGVLAFSNTSGATLGYATISVSVDNQLADLIRSAPRSNTGQIFVADGKGFLLAVTASDPYYSVRNGTAAETLLPGCQRVTKASLPVPKIGCRYYYANYTFFKPITVLPLSFILSKSLNTTDVTINNADYIVFANRFATNGGLAWSVVVFVPWSDLTGNVGKGRDMAIGIAVAILVAAVLLAVSITYVTVHPLSILAEKMEKTARLEGLDKDEELGDGDDDDDDDASSNGGGDDHDDQHRASLKQQQNHRLHQTSNGGAETNLTLASASMIKEIANLEIAYAFSHNQLVNFTRYVPKNVVKEVIHKGNDIDVMVPTSCAISFVDLANFTSICETTSPQALSSLLHAFFKKMTRLVMAHGGMVDRFVGDCIVAVWGAPFKIERHELLAALCAIAYQRETQKNPLKQLFLDQGINLAVRVGVASGNVLAGNVGSRDRKSYTVLGEAVQTADKLEAYNKYWGTGVMVSEEVARECNDELVLRLLTRIKLQGRAKPVMVYHCMGVQPDVARTSRRLKGNSEGRSESGQSDGLTARSFSTAHHSISASSNKTGSTSLLLLSNDGDASTSNNNAGQDFDGRTSTSDVLPSNIRLDRLLAWHQKRTSCDDNTAAFARDFGEAARCNIDHDFASALQKLQALETENWVPEKWRTHKSMGILKEMIRCNMQGGVGAASGGCLDD